jgi:membrane protease YdiL (CAAX protease family)
MQTALIDILIVAAGYVLTYFATRSLGLATPGVAAVVVCVAVAWWRLRANGQSFADVGLRKPAGWGGVVVAVLVLYVVCVAGVLLIISPIARALGWPDLDISRFADLPGHPDKLATLLALAWTTAAFGEELVFRGFLLDRIERLLGGRGGARAFVAVVGQAAIFGIAHRYLGPVGELTAAFVGLVYGAWFVLRGRNLWPLIIAHGLTDTISMTLIYLRAMPGTAH